MWTDAIHVQTGSNDARWTRFSEIRGLKAYYRSHVSQNNITLSATNPTHILPKIMMTFILYAFWLYHHYYIYDDSKCELLVRISNVYRTYVEKCYISTCVCALLTIIYYVNGDINRVLLLIVRCNFDKSTKI